MLPVDPADTSDPFLSPFFRRDETGELCVLFARELYGLEGSLSLSESSREMVWCLGRGLGVDSWLEPGELDLLDEPSAFKCFLPGKICYKYRHDYWDLEKKLIFFTK